MTITVQHDVFTTEAEALSIVEKAGLHPATAEVPAETLGDHWHYIDSLTFILDGEISLTDIESGESCVARKGACITAKAGVIHRDSHNGYRAVFGLSVPPEELTMPIAKMVVAA